MIKPEDIPVHFVQNDRAVRYIIKILPDQTVRVTIPRGGNLRFAQEFLKKHIEAIALKIQTKTIPRFEYDVVYKTKVSEFVIEKTLLSRPKATFKGRRMLIKLDQNADINNAQTHTFIQYCISQLLKIEAEHYLPKRTFELATKNGLKFKTVKINTAKTRFGSCSGTNEINFSSFLMAMPSHLIDYIILHELCHTIHKNHSAKFYELLNRVSGGNHLKYQKEVKKYSIQIQPSLFDIA